MADKIDLIVDRRSRRYDQPRIGNRQALKELDIGNIAEYRWYLGMLQFAHSSRIEINYGVFYLCLFQRLADYLAYAMITDNPGVKNRGNAISLAVFIRSE